MGKPDIATITAFECRSILDSIQNEYEQRQKEDSILSKLQEDLADLIAQRNILAKRKEFNEKYCVLCCSAFNLLFKRKVFCQDCNFWICRSCSLWDNSSKHWLCKVCEKQKLLDAESRAWICNRVKASFGNFGTAKALHSFCRSRRISDSENDSGYGTAGDFIPLMKLLSSLSLNKELKMSEISHDEDCEDDDDDVGDEEELAEIHHSIETILEGLLGGTLDDASVDYLYPNSCLYINLFSAYHVRLVEVIQNLSKALQKALHNLPSENGITPTTAHAALKNVIAALVEECQDLPPLQVSEQGECESNIISNFDFAEIFSSYDSLVAAAVINKIVEESQSKFKTSVYNSLEENPKIEENEKVYRQSTEHISEEAFENIVSSATGFDLPVECVQIEEIEEITQEFTDSEDDKLSSISKWSNSLQSVEEVGIQKHPDIDLFLGMDPSNDVPTPFPEFGCDLVDDPENKDCGITCHSTAVTSWEDNWLFRKKKRLPLYSNLKYQLLTYCDEPPCMLIPCPTETTDIVESDEFSSELSETHSAGSLEFSSDPDESKLGNENFELSSKLCNEATSKSLTPAVIDPSPDTEISELPDVQTLESQLNVECQVNESKSEKNAIPSKELGTEHEPSLPCEEEHLSLPCKEEHLSLPCEEKQVKSYSPLVENMCISTPPRPGTIAEREHKKWLNAVPLKNNPYSAENISKRFSYSKKAILKEPISSFEEFERKLSVSSETAESAMNKLNCGPKSIDSELYKRDYYVNKDYEIHGGNVYPVKKSKSMCSINDDCFDALSEEALNSFEEKVYISSGKVFTLENHVKRLERELKDLSPSSEMPSVQSFLSKAPLQ
ncbi:Rab effector MyRIP, partial [Stegodyphus mimosarum]